MRCALHNSFANVSHRTYAQHLRRICGGFAQDAARRFTSIYPSRKCFAYSRARYAHPKVTTFGHICAYLTSYTTSGDISEIVGEKCLGYGILGKIFKSIKYKMRIEWKIWAVTQHQAYHSQNSLDKNGLQFGFIALTNQWKQNNFLGQTIETNLLIWLLKTRQNDWTKLYLQPLTNGIVPSPILIL
jgi:hypothetical protein